MANDHPDVTRWLSAACRGEEGAQDELAPLVYGELRGLAARHLRNERPGHTWQPTALVDEAWLRIFGTGEVEEIDGRRHFFAAASEAMRRLLVEHARSKQSQRRGGGRRPVTFLDIGVSGDDAALDLIALDEALDELGVTVGKQFAEVVKLRFFVGLEIPEVASVLDVSVSTVKRDWVYARAWLYERLDRV